MISVASLLVPDLPNANDAADYRSVSPGVACRAAIHTQAVVNCLKIMVDLVESRVPLRKMVRS